MKHKAVTLVALLMLAHLSVGLSSDSCTSNCLACFSSDQADCAVCDDQFFRNVGQCLAVPASDASNAHSTDLRHGEDYQSSASSESFGYTKKNDYGNCDLLGFEIFPSYCAKCSEGYMRSSSGGCFTIDPNVDVETLTNSKNCLIGVDKHC